MLLIIAPFFISCEPDDDYVYTDKERYSRYTVYIGTHIAKGNIYLPGIERDFETNPNGSLKIRLPNGDVQLLKRQDVNITIGGEYRIEGNAGSYRDPFSETTRTTTNDIGDFYARVDLQTRNRDEKVTSLDQLTVLMSTNIDGRVYEKTFKYSSQTLWNIVKGTYNIFGDLGLSHVGTYTFQDDSYVKVIYHVFDLSSDIILELK